MNSEIIETQLKLITKQVETEHQKQRPFMLLKPKLFMEGNQWAAMYGDEPSLSLLGFGDTPEEAARDFDHAWYNLNISKK